MNDPRARFENFRTIGSEQPEPAYRPSAARMVVFILCCVAGGYFLGGLGRAAMEWNRGTSRFERRRAREEYVGVGREEMMRRLKSGGQVGAVAGGIFGCAAMLTGYGSRRRNR